MKNSNKEIMRIKILFRGVAAVVVVTGIFFSALIAQLNDAPGFALLGTAAVLGVAALIYGLGEILVQLKKNYILLSGINDKLDDEGGLNK